MSTVASPSNSVPQDPVSTLNPSPDQPSSDPAPGANPTPAPKPVQTSAPDPTAVLPPKPDFPPWVDNSKMTLIPWKKSKMTILLIGETGVGKTAFLDLLANVCAGRTLEEFKPEHISANEMGGSAAGSQTDKPAVYSITCANGYVVNVMDTPGLADTRGQDFDNRHKAAIAEAIKSQVETIDSVLVLANGTQERLGIPTQYALTVISGMFPHSIVDNIGFIFTMVSNPLQFNFKRDALQAALQKTKMWAIDNPLAGWMKYQKSLNSEEPVEDFILEDMRETIYATYGKTLKTLNSFFKWQDERVVQPVKAINDLYQMSTKIEASITNVLARITQTEQQQAEFKKMQNDIDAQKQIQKVNEKFRTVMKKPFHEHEMTSDHNTLCCAGECYSNCHEHCAVGFTPDRDVLGRDCQAFSSEKVSDGGFRCIRCGHSSKFHQHYRAKWIVKEKDETSEDADAKKRFEAAKSEEERIAIIKDQLDKKIKDLQASNDADEEELSRLCTEYNKLALSGSFVGYIVQAIRLLTLRYEKMKNEGSDADALDRMNERIVSLQKKKDVVEQAMKEKKAKDGSLFSRLKAKVVGS